MSRLSTARRTCTRRSGVALISVLYFLVLCALGTTAVLFAQRSASRNAAAVGGGVQLLAVAESAAYSALASWDGNARAHQAVGSTATLGNPPASGAGTTVSLTRLTTRIFSIVAEARTRSGLAARRVGLLLRLPALPPALRAPLVSAVDVTIGRDVRFVRDDTATCGDSATAAMILAPSAVSTLDSTPNAAQLTIVRTPAADDSSAYLRMADAWWDDLAERADIRLRAGAHADPMPTTAAGQCLSDDANWGDPNSLISPCAHRAPLVYAAGDLTIDGGRGQGVLLVDGRLVIAGPFEFSGQIVVRSGIETLADNIAISGVVSAWRAPTKASGSRAASSNIVLTHATTLRYFGCDARHDVASWLQPRLVWERAWSELF